MFEFKVIKKFIKKHRKEGTSSFKLLTTNDEIIIVAKIETDKSEQVRIKYK